jgi:hypothetical protein
MIRKVLIFIAGLLLISLPVFAQDDVSIDSNGNVRTGVSASGNFEVTGASGENGIVGATSGTGAVGVYGENTSNNYGTLGGDNYGVYGYSLSGWAGYFQGNARVTGSLTVDGTFTGNETDPRVGVLVNGNWCASDGSQINCNQSPPVLTESDPTVNSLGKATLSCTSGEVAKWNGSNWVCAVDVDTNTIYSEGTGIDLIGTTFNVEVPLALFGSASGGILSGENISPTGFGVWGRAANSSDVSNIGVYGQADGSYGAGVYGIAGASGGTNGNYGGWFEANGGAGWGVYARSHGTSGIGVYGHALNGGIGGYFNSEGGYGLIVQNGNVGIGTTSPVRNLEVASDQLPSNIVATGYRDGDAYSAGVFNGRKARGTMASPSAVQTDDILAAFGGYGYYDDGGSGAWPAGNTAVKARMQIVAAENWTVSAQGAYINFLTTPIGDLNRAEAMRITDAGNVGIGTTTPAQKLSVSGTIESTSGGIKFPDGTVQTTAAAPSWYQKLPAAERFILVLDDEAVLDKETGLVWEKSPATYTYNWTSAIARCTDLNVGGRKGWHLPTVEQLLSLVDSTQSNPSLPSGHPFLNVQTTLLYWSATTYAANTAYAWDVPFDNGIVFTYAKTGYNYVWCVRGGQSHDAY